MFGQSFSKLKLEIDDYIYGYKNFSTMSKQFCLCPWKLYHARLPPPVDSIRDITAVGNNYLKNQGHSNRISYEILAT